MDRGSTVNHARAGQKPPVTGQASTQNRGTYRRKGCDTKNMNNLAMKEDTQGNDSSNRFADLVLAALGRKLAGQQGPRNAPKAVSRQAAMQELMRKEAILQKALATPSGLKRIAANMANPVRVRLDYAGIGRRFVIVEQMPDGVPLIFDKDLPFVPAVKVAKGGAPRMIETRGKRVELTDFEVAARVKVPYAELYQRRYRALERAKDRLIEGLELREDLILFGLFETASTIANTPISVTGKLEKDTMARGFAQIEDNRLIVGSVLMSAFGTSSIRRWIFQDVDQLGMQELRETGYWGSLWGADFYVSDQIPDGTVQMSGFRGRPRSNNATISVKLQNGQHRGKTNLIRFEPVETKRRGEADDGCTARRRAPRVIVRPTRERVEAGRNVLLRLLEKEAA